MATVEQEVRALKMVVKAILDHLDEAGKIPGLDVAGPGQTVLSMATVLNVASGQSDIVEIIGQWSQDRQSMVERPNK